MVFQNRANFNLGYTSIVVSSANKYPVWLFRLYFEFILNDQFCYISWLSCSKTKLFLKNTIKYSFSIHRNPVTAKRMGKHYSSLHTKHNVREVGGGIGMGNTCKPMAVSFQCMTKSTTNKKNNNNKKINTMSFSTCSMTIFYILYSQLLKSCLTLCKPMDCSLPDSMGFSWNFPGKNTRVGCYFLLQGIFPTQG